MMGEYTMLVFIFGILILLVLVILFFLNNLLLKRKKVDFMFDSVVNYLKERMILLNNVSVFTLDNMENERKYLINVDRTSIALSKIVKSSEENLIEIKDSSKVLIKFIDLVKIYPKLKKNKIYNNLVEEIKLNEDRIIYAFNCYDEEVKKFNEFKRGKVYLIISRVFRIKDYGYYNK